MYIIEKTNFRTKEIQDNKLSMYSFYNFAILLQDISTLPDLKYRKGLNVISQTLGFDDVNVIEMTVEEKEIVDSNIAKEDFEKPFHENNCAIRITVRGELLKKGKKLADLCFDMLSDNPNDYNKWVDNKKYKVIYLEYLKLSDGFTLDENGIITSPDTDIVLEQLNNNFEVRIIDEDDCIAEIEQNNN